MSSLELPNELVGLIIDHLHDDKPTLKICALVCRDWIAPSRFHIFHDIHCYQNGVDTFISLCDSPFSTIHRANTCAFRLSTHLFVVGEPEVQQLQNSPALNKLLTWRSSDGQKTLATLLSQLRILALDWVGWWTLSHFAKETLAQFESLRELKTWNVVFETQDQFLALLGAFPKLEVLSMGGNYFRHREATANPGDPSLNIALPPRLHTISMKSLDDRSAPVVDALVPCHSLRVFHFHVVKFSDSGFACWDAIGKLLASAGPSLEVFSARVQAARFFNNGIDLSK